MLLSDLKMSNKRIIPMVLACFGPVDGARNAKNQVKKIFVDFQCYMGNFMLQEKKAKLQKMFI